MTRDQIDSHVFYPDLKFSCSGNITKISFIGERRRPTKDVMKYLRFSVWSTNVDNVDFKLEKALKKSLNFDLSRSSILVNGSDNNLALYQIQLKENEEFIFEEGDVFGIRQSDSNRSKVALLHQRGGGHSYRIELQSSTFHMKCFVTSLLAEIDLYPMIAIETGKCFAHMCMY